MKIELIDSMGDDITVVNAARVSMDKESEWEYDHLDDTYYVSERDKKLLKYLANHNHFTPFTHCTITLRETVPIFVARQRFKHTVGFTYNEVSRRYVDDTPEFYTPNGWRKRAENVKQGSSEDEIVETIIMRNNVERWSSDINDAYYNHLNSCEELYKAMLEANVAPEQARMVLPQSMYTSYYVTGSLYAFARAYKLRIDPHAQKEIRDVAVEWNKLICPIFPHSWSVLVD